MPRRKTTQEFIKEAIKVHGKRYDYSKVSYVNTHKRVTIICSKHGEYVQTPKLHLLGSGCQKCYEEIRGKSLLSNTNEFIKKAVNIHGDKYDYSKVIYINNRTKVIITCPIHGDYKQTPNSHLLGRGCTKCGRDEVAKKQKLTTDEFYRRVYEKHGNDLMIIQPFEYENQNQKVRVKCQKYPEHGEWETNAEVLYRSGCPKCGLLKIGDLKKHGIEYIQKFVAKHLKNSIELLPNWKFRTN
jgi:hypothetical protein